MKSQESYKETKEKVNKWDSFLNKLLKEIHPDFYVLDFNHKKTHILYINRIQYSTDNGIRKEFHLKKNLKLMITKESHDHYRLQCKDIFPFQMVESSFKGLLEEFQKNIYENHSELLEDLVNRINS